MANEIRKNNAKATTLIMNSISPKIFQDIEDLDSAFEMMEKLKLLYDVDQSILTDQWLNQLKNTKIRDISEITKTFVSMKTIFIKMQNANYNLQEKEKLHYMYRALPKNLKLAFVPNRNETADNYFERIINHIPFLNNLNGFNNQQEETGDNQVDEDFMDIDLISNYRKQNKHFKNKNYRKKQPRKFCHICNMKGHLTSECHYNGKTNNHNFKNKNIKHNTNKNFRREKYNNNNSQNFSNSADNIELIDNNHFQPEMDDKFNFEDLRAMIENPIDSIENIENEKNFSESNLYSPITKNNISTTHSTTWTYDSGTIAHTTNNKKLLTNFTKQKIYLKCANNTSIEFEGYGDFSGVINNNLIILKNVLYSKNVNKNLISGIQFAKSGIKTIINYENNQPCLSLFNNNDDLINKYYSNNGRSTFTIRFQHLQNNNNELLSIENSNWNKLWHRRLAHFYHKDINKYLKEHQIKPRMCPECAITKMKKLPHNGKPPKATRILEKIHSDIIGPIPKSIMGYQYVLTFIDEYSRKGWTFLLKSKAEAVDNIISFINYANNLFTNYKIKYFMSDQGKEYTSRKVKKVCNKYGIKKVFSPPYNPENNGIAERFNQTIITAAKTILFWSKLSTNFWDFAVKYAKYIYNLTPHSSINFSIPNELFFNKRATIKHIKVFGCIAFYKNFSQQKHKLDPNAKKGIFLGFNTQSNSYIIMDYHNHTIHQVREAVFFENTPAKLQYVNSDNFSNHDGSTSEGESLLTCYHWFESDEVSNEINSENLENSENNLNAASTSDNLESNTNSKNFVHESDNNNVSNNLNNLENFSKINDEKIKNLNYSKNFSTINNNFDNVNIPNFSNSDYKISYNKSSINSNNNNINKSNNNKNNNSNIITDNNPNSNNKNILEFNQNSNNIYNLENVYTENFSPKNDQQFIKFTVDLPPDILKEIQSLIPQKRPLSPTNYTTIGNKFKKFIHDNNYFIDSITNNISENPKTYNNAIKGKNAEKWLKAIKEELSNLYNNKTMTFVKFVPKNKNIITTKWVFSVKKDANNNIIKFKARLVARGYDQIFGIDYELTYSPTLNTDNIKLIISIASIYEWKITQLDIKSAYLNAPLDKEIYTTIPIGDPNYGKGYWKLNKALYGLKQSGRQWNQTISKFLIDNNFTQSLVDECIFYKKEKGKLVCLIGLYVDDMMITGETKEVKDITTKIKNNFKISKCGSIDFILGIKVEKNEIGYFLSQEAFINNLLEKFKINNRKKTKTPCTGTNLLSENKEPFDKKKYQSAIGSLNYLARSTRPDIAFATNLASRKSENPTITDWNKVLNILKYLNYTKNYILKYNGCRDLYAYSDASFANDLEDRKSTSGHIIFLGGSPITWYSKKQSSVATSTAEAEYISSAECIKKILQIKNLLFELIGYKRPIILFTDNTSSKINLENGKISSKLRHVNVCYHFCKETIKNKEIILRYCETSKMIADPLTKNINGTKMTEFTDKIFVKNNKEKSNYKPVNLLDELAVLNAEFKI